MRRTHLCSKCEAHAAIILAPAHGILIRIRPQQIAQQSLIGHVCGTHDASYLLHGRQIWTQATVAAEDLLIHDGGHRQAVEAVRESFPQLDGVATFTFVIEPAN